MNVRHYVNINKVALTLCWHINRATVAPNYVFEDNIEPFKQPNQEISQLFRPQTRGVLQNEQFRL